jgi:hypothetical protein
MQQDNRLPVAGTIVVDLSAVDLDRLGAQRATVVDVPSLDAGDNKQSEDKQCLKGRSQDRGVAHATGLIMDRSVNGPSVAQATGRVSSALSTLPAFESEGDQADRIAARL